MLPARIARPYSRKTGQARSHFSQEADDYQSYLSLRAYMQQLLLPRLHLPKISDHWSHIEEQAFEFGQVYDSYFATEEGWKRFRARGQDGLISYRRMGKYVKVIGGLLARDEEKPRLLREYNRLSDSFGLLTSFYNIGEKDLPLFREHGYQVTKWGEEPFVDLQECTWSGKPYEWVRRQTNYCRRAGVTIIEHKRHEMDDDSWTALLKQLRAVSDSLLATKAHSGEIKLVEGQLEVAGWGRRRLFVAYSQNSTPRIEGFLIALPMNGGRSWSFEMYRHRPDAIRGVVPHLFHEVMIRMKAEGIETVSLCLLPGIGCEEPLPGDCALTRRSLTFGKKRLNFLFDFAGLYHFKSRFRPRYEARYVCSRPRSTALTIFALFRMSGILTFDPKKAGTHLARNIFKRRERQQLADSGGSLALACQGGK
jgi:phosphatidylglycerol lysyltransferase